MIGIAIFEKDVEMAETMKDYIGGFLNNIGVVYRIDIFVTREDLLRVTVGKGSYDAVLFNVDSQEGVQMNIKTYMKETLLVLVSDSVGYAIEGYKMGAFRYILKSGRSFERDMDECMRAIIDKLQVDLGHKEFDFLEGRKCIPVNNVVYIESNLHKVAFYIWENGLKKYTKYGGINEVTEELIDYGFVRIHKSFSVNMFHIAELCRYHVSLGLGITLSVSKNRYKDIEEKYLMYKNKKFL